MIKITIIIILVVVVFVLGALYNSLVRLKTNIDESWAQIDVQLKRRCDLIPNIVETAKGYAKHEQETFQKVIEARNRMMSPGASKEDIMNENNIVESGLKSIFALTESYPDLKSNQMFSNVQEELISTENKISYSRQLYNSSVGTYNIKVRSFPANLLASIFGFKPEPMLEATQEEREVVKVSF